MDLQIKTTTYGGEVNWLTSEQKRFIEKGVTIDYTKVPLDDDNKRIIKSGMRLAKITASGKYCPVKVAEVHAEAAAAQADVKVKKGHNIQVGDVLQLNNEQGTVNAIDTTPADHDVLTMNGNLANILAAGTDIYTVDGSGEAKLLLYPHDVDCTDGDVIVSGLDWCRVKEDRLPGHLCLYEKINLSDVKFE